MVDEYKISRGKGRTKVMLRAQWIGSDLIILIYNKNAHIGAVSLGEYDPGTGRTSTSIITRLGHKDDIVAQKAAYQISKATKKPACIIAGIHVDDINRIEINEVLENILSLVEELIQGDFLSSLNKE